MSNLSSRLGGRTMPHKDVLICLNLDLLGERDEAMAAVDAAARTVRASGDRMVTVASPALQEARARVAELDEQIRDASITLRVVGVDRNTYNQWLNECPPRKGRQEPYDSSKFFIHAAKHSAKYVDENGNVHDITEQEWADIDATLTDGEHDRLAQAVVHVNRSVGQVDVGFFANGSETITDSSGISDSLGASESHPADSGDGNPQK